MSILTLNKLCKYLFIITLLAIVGCRQKSISHPAITPPEELFIKGDIAFRLGRTLQSGLIARSGDNGKNYSHIGIIIEHNDSLKVAHIEPDNSRPDERIICEPIADFFAYEKSATGCVVRHKELCDAQRHAIEGHTLRLLRSTIEFDHDYCLSDTTTMYCTELIEYIFSLEGVELSQSRRHTLPLVKESVILPSDILGNENLSEIWRFDYDDLRPAR